jgi:lipid-binding SYLF domain-containing protein
MRFSSAFRASVIALTALVTATVSAYADSGAISFKVVKAGFIIGGSGGSGTLTFQGHSYRLSIGGISAGLVFGAAETTFSGTVSHIRAAGDVAGVYAATGAGAAAGRGTGVISCSPTRRVRCWSCLGGSVD